MMSEMRSSAREWGQHQADRMHEMTDRCRDSAAATVDDYPLSTTLGVFGIGMCVGVAIGAALASSHSQSRFDHRAAAESLGRRMFDALHDYLPKGVNQYLHS
jgi:hypothetical protein